MIKVLSIRPFSNEVYQWSLPMKKEFTISAQRSTAQQIRIELSCWLGKNLGLNLTEKIITGSQKANEKREFVFQTANEIWLHHSPKMEKLFTRLRIKSEFIRRKFGKTFKKVITRPFFKRK